MESKVKFSNGTWEAPDNVTIGYIVGDGIGIDITPVTIDVLNAAIDKAFNGNKKINWEEIIIGEKALEKTGDILPEESLDKLKDLKIAIKGPLTTPVGKGFRSLNVTLRQKFDLYYAIRPIKYFEGLPSPMKNPEEIDMVIFRENTEDVYSGIEWPSGSKEAKEIIKYVKSTGKNIREDSGIGIKHISPYATKRLIKEAIDYAIKNKRKSLTIVHKGNIMKFTEGAFKEWGYEFLKENYGDKIIFEEDQKEESGKIVVKNRIADAMFQQVLLRPKEYDVIATTNLNGDYLSDALAAQVGGLGISPSANIGEGMAIFEATHGTAPKHAGKDEANPSSLILSGVMMLELIGWKEAADLIVKSLKKTITNRTVTYDLHRQMDNATLLKCSEFGKEIIKNMD